MNKSQVFTTKIEEAPRGGAYVVVPDTIIKELGLKSRSKVNATFNDVPYRGSLFSTGGSSVLGVTKDIRTKIGKDIGDEISVTLELDTAERIVHVPAELQDALDDNPDLTKKFDALAFTYRKEFSKWISNAKKMETRERRLKKAIQMIIDGEKP